MSRKYFLTTAISLAFSTSIISCGHSDKNSVADIPASTYPRSATAIRAHFTPRSQELVDSSVLHLSGNQGSRYISEGYSVHPFNREQEIKVQAMVDETNRYRKAHGIAPLKYDPRLSAYAYVRADEIRHKYSHLRPDGTNSFSGLSIGDGWKGENLDASRESVKDAFSAWVNSREHNENLLNPKFERIGVAYVYDPNSPHQYHWAQIFASDDLSTPYHFDPKMAGTFPEMEKHLNGKIILQNGQIALSGGQSSTTDNAAIARDRGELTHAIYNRSRHYDHNGYQAIIQEPAGGFSYQTFGEVVDANYEPVQYLNIGQPTIPETNAHFQATYRGVSMGNVNKHSHVYADVVADVDFGQAKTMDLRFENSQIARGDITNHNPNVRLSNVKALDFAERLRWNAQKGHFKGDTTTANFYGPNGEEMGGNFSRATSVGHYEGVFGLKKQ